jgi:hypothetical protein
MREDDNFPFLYDACKGDEEAARLWGGDEPQAREKGTGLHDQPPAPSSDHRRRERFPS